jgi:hypothetical protein
VDPWIGDFARLPQRKEVLTSRGDGLELTSRSDVACIACAPGHSRE